MREFARLAAVPALMLGLGGCDLLGGAKQAENKVATTTTKTSSAAGRLCAANATYLRLKESAFDEAKRIRERDTESLDALADASVVRMENPLLESRDEALGLTVCSGRMILELPPGAGAAFDGRQRLAADVTYSAQAAADGSGTVFKIDGGEPIVYRLAGFDPARGATRVAVADPIDVPEPGPVVGEAEPDIDDVETPAPVITPAQQRSRAQASREAAAAAAERTAYLRRIREDERRAELARTAQIEERARREARIATARRDERGEAEPRAARTATARPSFNCRYARSRVEKQICGSSDLAARDRAMANVYSRANDRADGETKRALSASRLRFLAYRDRCGSEECVASAYEDRIAEINDIAGE